MFCPLETSLRQIIMGLQSPVTLQSAYTECEKQIPGFVPTNSTEGGSNEVEHTLESMEMDKLVRYEDTTDLVYILK